MPRIRTVKPEFFRHEGLQDLQSSTSIPVMLIFCALWGHCDRNGTFEWKPRQLKLDILPFLDFSMDEALELLKGAGFVHRFTVDGKVYGNIHSFSTHQRLGGKEAQEPERFPQKPQGNQEEAEQEAPGKQWGSSGEAVVKQSGSGGEKVNAQEGKGREKEKEGKSVSRPLRGSTLPDDFQISDRVKAWAEEKGYAPFLKDHFDYFRSYCKSSGKRYLDFDEAFMNCIRANWGDVRKVKPQESRPGAQASAAPIIAEIREAAKVKAPMPESIRNLMRLA